MKAHAEARFFASQQRVWIAKTQQVALEQAEHCPLRAARSQAARRKGCKLCHSYLGAPSSGRLPAAVREWLVRLSSNSTLLKEWAYFPCHLSLLLQWQKLAYWAPQCTFLQNTLSLLGKTTIIITETFWDHKDSTKTLLCWFPSGGQSPALQGRGTSDCGGTHVAGCCSPKPHWQQRNWLRSMRFLPCSTLDPGSSTSPASSTSSGALRLAQLPCDF